jgi:DNA primase
MNMDVETGPVTRMDIMGRAIGIAIEGTATVHERDIVFIPVLVPGIAVEIRREKYTATVPEKAIIIDLDPEPGTAVVVMSGEVASENRYLIQSPKAHQIMTTSIQ